MIPLTKILIYTGHQKHPLLGPYFGNVEKRIQTFKLLNAYRPHKWDVLPITGEDLPHALRALKEPRRVLLVIPAGQSTSLDAVFSSLEIKLIQDFISQGGLGYFTCGSAYWVSQQRIFHGVCSEQPQNPKTLLKSARLPLFEGVAEGPLCPFPGKGHIPYRTGFYSDAVTVCLNSLRMQAPSTCTVLLSGGGSFRLSEKSSQKIKILARYPHAELMRLGKRKEECTAWENAALLASVGKGAALLAMFHPYYGKQGPQEIDVEAYEQAFPGCGTNWKEVNEKISPLEIRMRFLNELISQLEAHAS